MFLIDCPNCGARNAAEFRYGGEYNPRLLDASAREWAAYVYARDNCLGVQKEWWYHRAGCRRWFLAWRHTGTNHVVETRWPDETGHAGGLPERRSEPVEAQPPEPGEGRSARGGEQPLDEF
jgi:sarcosine oxidase subunit delta